MSMLIYIHGTNGSGKSTLARKLIDYYGAGEVVPLSGNPKASYTRTNNEYIVLAGKYANACGGVDGVSPYAVCHDIFAINALLNRNVIAEGLITPGLETCEKFASLFDKHLYIHLNTPIKTCIEHVLIRRSAKGNDKEFNSTNLIKKRVSAESWYRRLTTAGLTTAELNFDQAFETIISELYYAH